ncbi:MAG TPA: PH domain-containing protein [Jiangellales bacterium]|nr:PH domain-containing protein [Jiangellales bacterium]
MTDRPEGLPVGDLAGSVPADPAPPAGQPTPDHFRRLHPLTPLLRGWVWLVAAVAFGGQDAIREGEVLRLAIIAPVVAVVGFVAGLASWWFTRYGIDGGDLRIDSGVVFRRSRRVRLDRLQAVDVVRPLAGRILGVSELRLEVAGGGSTEAPLAYLSADDALALRAELLARAAGIDAHTPEAPERPLLSVPLSDLVVSTLLSGTFVVGALLVLGMGVAAGLLGPQEMAIGVLPLMLPGIIAVVSALYQQVVRNFGFTIAESPDGLRIRKGLLDTTAQTVPPGRVQGVALHQPLLWRWRDWVQVKVDVAGYAGSPGGEVSTSILLPVGTPAAARDLVARALPGAEPLTVPLVPAPRSAVWFAPIAWRRLAYGVDDRVVVVREGVLHRTLTVVPHAKTQSVRLHQGPLQRRLDLATAYVDTTPGPVDAVVRHRPAAEAREFVMDQADRSRAARRADTPERWMVPSAAEAGPADVPATPGSAEDPVRVTEPGRELEADGLHEPTEAPQASRPEQLGRLAGPDER